MPVIPFLQFSFRYSLAKVLIILSQEERSWGCYVNFVTLLASNSGGGGVVGVAMVFLGLQPVVCLARRTGGFICTQKYERRY
jgi:hypothetical protein